MKSKITTRKLLLTILFLSSLSISKNQLNAQHVEVQGELKVTQMNVDDTQENLVIKNMDGTLGTRSVASLPPPPAPIDTTRNLASDFELAKHLCECPNLPPFMIQKLLDSGYTAEDLILSGTPVQNVIDAQRNGILIDTRDNKSYKTVKIGTQTWMAKNLNYGKRIDGVNNQTNNTMIEKYCHNNIEDNCETYGALYQWSEMMQYVTTEGTQGICPSGFHIPSDAEWKTLEVELGMIQAQADAIGNRGTDQGSQLADNISLWSDGDLVQDPTFGTSGFTALPDGIRLPSGTFGNQSFSTSFWTSSESGINAWNRTISFNTSKIDRLDVVSKSYGVSVRCVQD